MEEVEKTETDDAKVRFIGDPSDDFSGPSSMSKFGMEFPKGKFVAVKDPETRRKLRGHSHFEFEGDEEAEGSRRETDELPALKLEALKEIAAAEGVDFPANTTKAKLMEAIREARIERGNDDN